MQTLHLVLFLLILLKSEASQESNEVKRWVHLIAEMQSLDPSLLKKEAF